MTRSRLRTRDLVLGTASLVVVAAFAFVAIGLVVPGTSLGQGLNAAVGPYFAERWRVFAPNLLKVNLRLSVQAAWRDDSGQFIDSEWVDVTGIEYRGMTGRIAPSKVQQQTWEAATNYLQRYDSLTASQRDRVQDTFIQYQGGKYSSIPGATLVDQMTANGAADQSTVVRFLRYDNMLKRYAMAFATAYFGDQVERVRWRIDRTRANDYEERFDDDPEYDLSPIVFGWRDGDVTLSPDVLATFEDFLERYGKQHGQGE